MNLTSPWILLTALILPCSLAQLFPNTEYCPIILPQDERPSLSSSGRIINGTEPTGPLRNSMVAIVSEYDSLLCSGTLLSEKWVLTAGHCPVTPGDYFVRIGGRNEMDGIRVPISKAFVHPRFSLERISADVQLLRLARKAPPFSEFMLLNNNTASPKDFAFARAAGYGVIREGGYVHGNLLQVDVPIQPFSICSNHVDDLDLGVSINDKHHICTGYKDGGCSPCFGDSGGPLFVFDSEGNKVQVGVISFGTSCGEPRASAVYTRISSYLQWARSVGADFQEYENGENVMLENGIPGKTLLEEEVELEAELLATAEPSDVPDMEDIDDQPNSECFPALATVLVEDGSTKTMEQLVVGDRVQVGPSRFSEIILFTHRLPRGMHDFVHLYIANQVIPLVLSRGHILPANGKMKAAWEMRVGDIVELGNGNTTAIENIRFGRAQGLFNPQTEDGRIVVDGIVASTYTTAVDMNIAHALLAPLRFVSSIRSVLRRPLHHRHQDIFQLLSHI